MDNFKLFALWGFFVYSMLTLNSHVYAQSDVVNLDQLTHDDFYALVDQITAEKLENVKQLIDDKAKLAGFHKVRQIAVDKLKQILPFSEIQNIIVSKGKEFCLVYTVSSLLGDLIIPGILFMMGQPELAFFVAGLPINAVTMPSYFYFSISRERKLIANELGYDIKKLKALEELKAEILEFTVDNRILSIFYDELEKDQEFVVVKKTFMQKITRKALPKGQIDLKRLEQIFVKHYSKSQLAIIEQLSDLNQAVYVQIIMEYLKNNHEAKKELNEYLVTQNGYFGGENQLKGVRKDLIKFDNQRKLINMQIIEYRKNIKELKSHAHAGDQQMILGKLSTIEKKIKQLELLTKDMSIFEYDYLEEVNKVMSEGKLEDLENNLKSPTDKFQMIVDRYSKIINEQSDSLGDGGSGSCIILVHLFLTGLK